MKPNIRKLEDATQNSGLDQGFLCWRSLAPMVEPWSLLEALLRAFICAIIWLLIWGILPEALL